MAVTVFTIKSLPKDDITEPSVTRDLFIFAPSFSRTPVAPVESARSLKTNYLEEVLHFFARDLAQTFNFH